MAEKGAAIAFSRSGDPDVGEYDDATIIGIFGDVTDEILEGLAA
jgi:hypothetical protein